jgi:hypothetical protein
MVASAIAAPAQRGPMEDLRRVAYESVGKACGFATLAVFCVLIGLSYNPALATKTGGILMTLLAVVLLMQGLWAGARDYRSTEAYLILPEDRRPPAATAQWAFSTALREAYLRFAQYSAAIAAICWAMTLVLYAISLRNGA